MGIEQFGKLPYFRDLIQKFLLPIKTPDQIKIRMKNLGVKKAADNAVKVRIITELLDESMLMNFVCRLHRLWTPGDQFVCQSQRYCWQ